MFGLDSEDGYRKAQRRAHWATAAGCLVIFAGSLCSGLWLMAGDRIEGVLRGETDLRGRPTWMTIEEPAAAVLNGVDLVYVHQELFPRWLIARAHMYGDDGSGEERQTFDALSEALAPDPKLTILAEQLRAELDLGAYERSEQAFAVIEEWNAYLDRQEQPLMMVPAVMLGDEPYLYTKNYEVLYDGEVAVGEGIFRARVVTRIDITNVVEAYLGMTSGAEQGALVLVDRLAEFVVDQLWPLMDPLGDEKLTEQQRAFAPAIRAALGAALDADTVELLARTAPQRAAMVQVADQINARDACGSSFQIRAMPWWGFDRETLGQLRGYARRDFGDDCPWITGEEVAILERGYEELVSTEGLAPALESLVATAARGVMIHEARHAADDGANGDLEPLPCERCPETLGHSGRSEMSAYLASFADGPTGALSLFQACELDRDMGGGHIRALEFIEPQLLPDGCLDGPPPDLVERAKAAEQAWLGRSEGIVLSPDFPEQLPL